jgi:outer membrane protein X
MKKQLLILTALFFMASLSLHAQDSKPTVTFKKFKVDVSLGYASPQVSGPGTKAGVLFAIEPKYAVMNDLSVGIRMEAAVMANLDKNGSSGNAKANYSYIATGDYYFSEKKFRPFLGAGAGIYTFASVDLNSNISGVNSIPVSSKFGFMTRAGFEYGHLRVGAEYNFVGDKMGYLGLKIGVVIGGGRK